ncbi:sensor histidine kinase LiaS [mine drainage metagenome]|uniref:Sensor histidine kinase LiaS n=1 Tax=mine drainage metagenome TaxID=410659 RepID=A0A1J5QVP6_9ZZZZ
MTFFATRRLLGLSVIPWLVFVVFSLSNNAWASPALDVWRIEAVSTRNLAESDAPAAYQKAEHLEYMLPAEATPIDRAQLLNLLSRIEIYLALTDRAATHAQQASDLARKHADRVGQVEADLNIALIAVNQGRLDAMVAAVTDGMEKINGMDRSDLLGEVMLRVAMMYRRQNWFDESVTVTMQAMEIAQRSNDPVALIYAHQGMAISFDQSGRQQEARDHYLKMRELARATHMSRLEADAIIGLGRVDSHLGNLPDGERLIRESIDIYRKSGSPFNVTFGLFALAENLANQGYVAASVTALDKAVVIYEKYPNKIGLWWTLSARSKYYQSLNRTDAARADVERAYMLAKQIGFPLYLSESAKRMAAIAASRGEHRRAYELLSEADAMSAQAARENVRARMLELAKRYKSESKQREINALSLRNERQANEIHRQSLQYRWLTTLVVGGFSVLLITIFFLLRLRRSHQQLQRFQNHQQAILDAIPDLLFELGLDGRYYDCHALHPDLLAAPIQELLGKTVFDVLPQGMCWFELSIARKAMVGTETARFIVLSRDITQRKQYDMLEKARLDILDKLSQDAPLVEVLLPLLVSVERLYPELLSSIMLLDGSGYLRCIPTPSLSEDYIAAIDGVLVGEGMGSCGTAAARGETVIVADVREHPYWGAYKHLALQAGLLACWSEPIVDSSGKVLGTFSVYRHESGVPSVLELASVRQASHLAAVAIERRQLQDALTLRELEFRTLAENSPDIVARFDNNDHYVYCNPQFLKVIGRTKAEVIGKAPVELRDDEVIACFQGKIEEVLCTGLKVELVHIVPVQGGRNIHEHIWFTPEFDPLGRVVSVLLVGHDVSAIKEVERQLSTLVEHLPDLVIRLNAQGQYLYVSPAVSKLFGMPAEAFIGKTIVDVGMAGDSASDMALLNAIQACAQEGVCMMSEMTFRHPSGDRMFDIMHVPECNEFGDVETVLMVARDVTGLRLAHNTLQEKEVLLRCLIDSIPDLIFFKNTNSVYLGFNKAFAGFCGRSEADLIGKTDYDFTTSAAAAFFQKKDAEMLASGVMCHNDEWVTFPDGREVLLNTMKTPLFDVGGKVIGVIGISRDITERYQMEQELMKREREFRTLAESAPDNIVRYDDEARMLYINPVLERTIGLPAVEVLGRRIDDIYPRNEAILRYQKVLEQVIASGSPAEFEMVSEPIGGNRAIYDLIKIVPELDEEGVVVGAVAIGRDYTELKAAERSLEESQYMLRQLAARSESNLENEHKALAQAVHDELGQYLMALRMNVTAIGVEFGANSPALKEKTDRLIELMDITILVVRNVVASLRPKALDMGVVPALEWLVDEHQTRTKILCELQVCDEGIHLDDKRATAVFRIVQESLTNISRHAEASKIVIVLEKNESQYVLQVRDNGKGFDTAIRKDKSFGLVGMHERAYMLGGKVEVSSEVGLGTMIKVFIPVNDIWSEEEEWLEY